LILRAFSRVSAMFDHASRARAYICAFCRSPDSTANDPAIVPCCNPAPPPRLFRAAARLAAIWLASASSNVCGIRPACKSANVLESLSRLYAAN